MEMGPDDSNGKEALHSKLEKANTNGMSESGQAELKFVLKEFGNIVKMKLDGIEPARIKPLRMGLKPGAVLVQGEQRRYPPPKRDFVKK